MLWVPSACEGEWKKGIFLERESPLSAPGKSLFASCILKGGRCFPDLGEGICKATLSQLLREMSRRLGNLAEA